MRFLPHVENDPELLAEATKSKASIKIQGGVCEYKVSYRNMQTPHGKRGDITDFSPRARLTMLKHFQRINFADHPDPIFVTLTYPDALATPSLEKRNIHRKVMARHLEKVTGAPIPAAWRVEWVPRKSGILVDQMCPHWHWLIFRHRFIHRDDVNRLWRETIGHDGYVRTQTKRVRRNSAISMYMAKYISKDAVSLSLVIATYQNRIGRSYGWLRKSEIPVHPETVHSGLSRSHRDAMMALAAERLPWVREGLEESFTLFGEGAHAARRIFDGRETEGDAREATTAGTPAMHGRDDQ